MDIEIDMTKHGSIIGETQTGKTIFSNFLFNQTGGLFIDIEDKGDIDAEISFNINNSELRFIRALKERKTVRYVPSPRIEKSLKEVEYIWRVLMKLNMHIFVYVDEIQNWGNAVKNAFDVFAIRGLKHGIHLISITQSPSNLSKTIARQTPTWVFFDIGDFERAYFDRYKLPYDRILSKFYEEDDKGDLIRIAPQYSFVIYRRGLRSVSEPMKIEIN